MLKNREDEGKLKVRNQTFFASFCFSFSLKFYQCWCSLVGYNVALTQRRSWVQFPTLVFFLLVVCVGTRDECLGEFVGSVEEFIKNLQIKLQSKLNLTYKKPIHTHSTHSTHSK